jgi:hypothetical protein
MRAPAFARFQTLSEPRVKRPKAAGTSGCRICPTAPTETALHGIFRSDRSLRPEFWRIPSFVRGSEGAPAFARFQTLSEPRVKRPKAAGTSGCRICPTAPTETALHGLFRSETAHSGRNSGEFRPSFAALKEPLLLPASDAFGAASEAARTRRGSERFTSPAVRRYAVRLSSVRVRAVPAQGAPRELRTGTKASAILQGGNACHRRLRLCAWTPPA